MSVWHTLRTNPIRPVVIVLVLMFTIGAVLAVGNLVDPGALGLAFTNLADQPLVATAAIGGFGVAFAIRSLVWVRVLPDLGFWHAWSAIHVALAGNHVLPLRLGEPLRVLSVTRRTGIPASRATATTLTLRSADIVSVLALAAVLGSASITRLPVGMWVVVALAAGAGVFGLIWTARLKQDSSGIRLAGPLVLGGTVAAWFAEACLVWVVAGAAGLPLSFLQAVFVTSVSVASQVAAIAPGGFGTYEAGAVAAYVYLGFDPGVALAAALAAHALKTAYSVVVGGIGLFTPAPGMTGRFRLPARLPPAPGAGSARPDQPVIVFFPAHNEQGTVSDVVQRVPDRVLGHTVVTMVVDDGSSDRTAAVSRSAGAKVVSLPENQGLGAAVRCGLRLSLERDAAAVVFLDADGEYAPEELEPILRPILAGEADYVVGSRFAGDIERMLPHRRLGNKVLTWWLSWVARARISDGQSGYRALSRHAAEAAEIVHDYNYAQVLTLDLIGKGFRYREVPISYRFRTTGDSFVRLGRYVRRVIPAVYREVNGLGGYQSSTT